MPNNNQNKIDASLFEDTLHPEVSGEQSVAKVDQSLFEDTPHPEMHGEFQTLTGQLEAEDKQVEEAKKNGPIVDGDRSFLVGAGQGMTGGFAEEVTAPVVSAIADPKAALTAAGTKMKEWLPFMEPNKADLEQKQRFEELMQAYRDVAREEQQAAAEQQPGQYIAGNVAGSIITAPLAGKALAGTAGLAKALPGGVAAAESLATGANAIKNSTGVSGLVLKGALAGTKAAPQGFVAGMGEGEGSVTDRLDSGVQGAKMGFGFGAGLSTAGNAVKGTVNTGVKIAKKLPVIRKAGELFDDAFKTGEVLAEEGTRKKVADTDVKLKEELFQDVKNLWKSVGEKVKSGYKAADDAGKNLNLTDEVKVIREKINKIRASNPTDDLKQYADGLESEIDDLLPGFKGKKAPVSDIQAPEGLGDDFASAPPPPEPKFDAVKPSTAQKLRQKLYDYKTDTNKYVQTGREAANDMYGGVKNKLDDATELNMPQLNEHGEEIGPSVNQQYGTMKDVFDHVLKIDPNDYEFNNIQKLQQKFRSVAGEGVGADKARTLEGHLVERLGEVDSKLAAKHDAALNASSKRMGLANELNKGLNSGSGVGGTIATTIKAGANYAGKGAHNLANSRVGKATGALIDAAKTIPAGTGVNSGYLLGTGAPGMRQAQEPHMRQQRLAKAAEQAEPEVLTSQASEIRTKHGKAGEQLATILDNMSKKDKDARRALMFTILQNPSHRKMMGLTDDVETDPYTGEVK